MRKQKYVYNESTLQYEVVNRTAKTWILRVLGFFSATLLLSLVFFFIADKYINTPSKIALQKNVKQLESHVTALDDEIDLISSVLANVQERDAGIHRMLFGMDPIDSHVWEGGTGGHQQYAELDRLGESGQLLKATREKVDLLKRQIYIQSKSLDTLEMKAKEKEQMLASIPSIKPVRVDHLKRNLRLLSGFGIRLHPVHKVKKMHQGIDFTAPSGTDIQATGDGKVVRVEQKRTGYGKSVIIDHGYGFRTLYAHMKEVDVKKGERVVKGQKIGTVGSTGTSTAPHCHYEVRFNGKPVNPIHYVMDGLSPEEYQELVEKASKANQSFD